MSTDEEVPRMLGLTISDSENKLHPYTLSMVAEKLGFNSWNQADKLLKKINADHGVNLRETDNRYHCKIKTGKKEKSATHKWSQEAVDLLRAVRDGVSYKVEL